MTSDIGMWYNMDDDDYVLYKIDKIEDVYRRRFHLKKEKNWYSKEYLSDPYKFLKNKADSESYIK